MMKAPNYDRTNGLQDLVDRRVTWGDERARVEEVAITEDKGAVATIVLIKNGKRKQVPVDHLRLVPVELLPTEDRPHE